MLVGILRNVVCGVFGLWWSECEVWCGGYGNCDSVAGLELLW